MITPLMNLLAATLWQPTSPNFLWGFPSFVEIGDGDTMSEVNFGCVFPRLVVALTKSGSIVGVCGHAVHT
jgi:hypothetical protein